MDPITYNRLQHLVEELLAEDPAGWPQWLEAHCGDEPELRARVLELAGLVDDAAGAFTDEGIASRREELDGALETGATDPGDGGWMPDRVGPYEIIDLIGRGGSGVVFRARQARPAREVALKLLSPAFATSDTMARLEREAEILGRLQHPGIAQVYDAGTFDGGFGEQPYLVMELVHGDDVVSHARARGLDRQARVRLVVAILEAIDHAHGRGVVHRDLKPDNVLVDEAGRPRLLDFGIARLAAHTGAATAFTADGQLLGTAAYMPPEQASGKGPPVGPVGDVFSAGAIAYELITDRRPRNLEGLSITQALAELTEQRIRAPRRFDPSIPRDLETVIITALDEDPDRRYPTAAAFAADLHRVLDGRPIAARPPGPLERTLKWVRRNRAVTAGALVLVVGLAATLLQATRAREAGARAQRGRYAAEMLVESSMAMDPVTQGRATETLARWAPGAPDAAAVDALGEERWEWHLLRSIEMPDVLEIGAGDGPTGADWHPDGSRIAVAYGASLAIHDASTGERLEGIKLPPGTGALLLGVNWDPSGERVAACGAYRTVVWRPDGQGGALDLDAPTPGAIDSHWRSKDTLWVSAHELYVMDLRGGEITTPFPESLIPMQGLVLHPEDGRALVLDGRRGFTWIDPAGVRPPEQFLPDLWTYAGVSTDPSGEWFVASTFENAVFALSTRTGEERWRSDVHREPILDCDWHPIEDRAATGSDDGTVRILDGVTGAELAAMGGNTMPIRDVRWSPDGSRLLSVSTGERVRIWSPEARLAVRRLRPESAMPDNTEAGRLSWCPARRELHIAHRGGSVAYSFEDEAFDQARPSSSFSVVDEGGRVEALAGYSSSVQLRALDGPEGRYAELQLGDDTFTDLDWADEGRVLCAGNQDGIWRIEVPVPGPDGTLGPLETTRLLVPEIQFTDLRVDARGRRVAATSTYSKVFVAFVDGSGSYELDLGARAVARSVTWAPAGDRFAVGTYGGSIHLFTAADGAPLGELSGASRQLHAVAWHPSGDRIAAGGRDGSLRIWSVASGALVASYPVPTHVSDLAWIEQGRVLACLGFDGVVTLWDAGRSMETAGSRPGRQGGVDSAHGER